MTDFTAALVSDLRKGYIYSIQENNILKPINFLGRVYRFLSAGYRSKQDQKVANFLLHHLQLITAQVALDEKKIKQLTREEKYKLEFAKIFYNKFCKRGRCYSRKTREIFQKLQIEWQSLLLDKKFSLPLEHLKQNPQFLNFAFKNHLHHRIDKFYRQNSLGIIYNKASQCLELPFKEPYSTAKTWRPWNALPLDDKKRIKGYGLFAYGWEPYSNRKWTQLKPLKIFKSQLKTACIELVTIYPCQGRNHFGHVYLNFYIPQLKDQVAQYSVGYNLTDLTLQDPREFIKTERLTTRRLFPIQQWKEIKKLIENIQYIHQQKFKKFFFRHPEKKLRKFYRKAMDINCGNFAVALFNYTTHERGLKTRLPVMKVLFPKFLNRCFDHLEWCLPKSLRIVIQKIKIVTHGVYPSHLIKKQRGLQSYPPLSLFI